MSQTSFQREERYVVIKRKDLAALPPYAARVAVMILSSLASIAPHMPRRECLVVESDWPEYEPTWAAIQSRMEGTSPASAECACGDLYPAKSYGAGFMAANDGVCENCDASQPGIPAPVARNLLGELYQVLGALDAGAKVLDQVSAAINGQPLPYETLLPYVGRPGEMPADAQPRLVSYSEAMETCTLHHQGREYYFTLDGRSDEEHELLGYIEPPVLLDLLQGSDATTKIRSAVPSLTNPDPGPGESWAVPIFVVRRQGGPQ